jgi:hypothetical protein
MILDERGDWYTIAAFLASLILLGATGAATDVSVLAYGRQHLWAVLSVGARAAARCLLATSPEVSTCIPTVLHEVAIASMREGPVLGGTLTLTGWSPGPPPWVAVSGNAQVELPFPFPGIVSQVVLSDQARAELVSKPGGMP